MDLRWLDDVLILLEEKNMTRAAARRNITQPDFSRRIRGFENWLGIAILQRGTNKIEISPALFSNEKEIRALVLRLQDLRSKIADFNPASSTVSIAAQHAPVFSTFPDMALRANHVFPSLKFRLQADNMRNCVTMFLRGDTHMLLCYESKNAGPLPFDASIRRGLWGIDYLVPVVGGRLRYAVKDSGEIAPATPAIVYPDNSYFGEVLNVGERLFGTRNHSKDPVCETAFSSGMKELTLKDIGVSWLPYSMVHRELETGDLISLANTYGQEPLEVAIYADIKEEIALAVLQVWSKAPNIREEQTAQAL